MWQVVLMSATMNSEKFSQFFGYCPIITIPGRMFDVTEHYIEDYVSCVAGPLANQGGANGVEAWRRERIERGRERAKMANENSEQLLALRKRGLDADELAAVAAMSDENTEVAFLEFGGVGFAHFFQIVMHRTWLAHPAPTRTEWARDGILVPLENLHHIVDRDLRRVPDETVSPARAAGAENKTGL